MCNARPIGLTSAFTLPARACIGARRLRGGVRIAIGAALVSAVSAFLASPARAQAAGQTVRVPLTIDYLALSAALKQQLYTDNGRAMLWNGSDNCQYFYAENPVFSRSGEQIKLESGGSLSIGVAMGTGCISPIAWNGIIEAETAPYIAPHLLLKFHVTDINLYDQQHQKTLIAGKGFDLVKQYFIPRLETFSFDLNPATQQLQDLAQAAAPPEVAERVKETLATLQAEPQLRAEDNGVRATLDLTVPAFATPAATPPPAAALSPEELAAFEKQLDQWDAFLVFSIKQIGDVNQDPKLRDDLMSLLLDSRHRLVSALANPQAGGPDPVRVLFLDEWQRLGGIIRDAARRHTVGNRALEFLSFISAGDALFALDAAAPALGMRISADDLRRLAHIMAPQMKADPLKFNFEEDPELREMFHVKAPLASEGPLDTQPSVIGTPGAGAAATAGAEAPSSPAPSAAPQPSPTASPPRPAAPSPTSLLDLLRWFSPDEAFAAQPPPKTDELVMKLQELAKKLKRAVVGDDNADEYRANVGTLLEYDAQRELAEEDLDPRYRTLYVRLVKSVAWQESCWRQFVLKGNRVVYLESSTHDLGLMQVNKFVWRGFYSVPRLEWDVLYNASAGMEILARLLEDTAGKRGAFTPGKPDELARSVYAAYNGGPDSYRRWRRPEGHLQRIIDTSFWQKYQAVARGQQINILSCAAEWSQEH
jgi:soluble lytic murein transglycosylase-like protein